ncbi:MAG TPA: dual specificity protein phosphatase family protein [Thermoanaerobaculia bacterium]|nr:dual specificity protein phosphatase family protein [Thermoanaerobaculia bacterium]HUM30485.1 dual specificity protein phosphatase family protein [Thermoanaerobaculia bacterium]HXK68648.1 dual specificity protein phosphatase family protein [Thermoanaerobaculia bacterium]
MFRTVLFLLAIQASLCLASDCPGCAPCTKDLTSLSDRGDGLINWARVDNQVYRGGQPFIRGNINGYETLQSMGIKTIINLRALGGREGQNILEMNTKTRDKNKRIYYVHIPLSTSKTDINYLNSQLNLILRAVLESPPPVFVHCNNGRERTGLVIAAYRMLTYRWPLDRSIREMELCHFIESRSNDHFLLFLRWWSTYRLPLLKPEVR